MQESTSSEFHKSGQAATIDLEHEIQVSFPNIDETKSQDEEFCYITVDGIRRRVRFHDYHEVFSIPGLYESIFHEHLKCSSPDVVTKLFELELRKADAAADSLSILEIGAGNGMVGERLRAAGVPKIVGVDILIEAKVAAMRDRPDVYEDYFALDLTRIPEEIDLKLDTETFDALVSVAALGFDDLPPAAYMQAFNYIEAGGWIVFNIKDEFLSPDDTTGFSRLIRRMTQEGILEIRAEEKYRHRLSMDKNPLPYVAIVGTKKESIPKKWLAEFS